MLTRWFGAWRSGGSVGRHFGVRRRGAPRGARVRDAVIVTVFPDSADKYMSERFWNAPA